MTPVRISFVTTGLQSGGAERMLFNLLSGLDQQQFKTTVISLREAEQWRAPIEQLGVSVQSIEMEPSRPTPSGLRRLRRFVWESAPDIVQGWMYHGNIAALGAVAPRMQVPVCWSIHHSIYGLRNEKPLTAAMIGLGAMVSRLPSKIMYVSHMSRMQHEQLGYHSKRGCVIPNGVDMTLFRPRPEARAQLRAGLGLPADAFLVGLIARFHAQKDHGTFLNAAAQVAQIHPNAYFLLAGRGTDTHNAELTELVAAAGIADRVRLLGERNDVPQITAALDVACSTSVFGEALSLALLEAMACGVPCVVTDVGDSAHLVGETGIVIPPRDSAGLVRALERLIGAGANTRNALGQMAQRRVTERYSLQRIVQIYEEHYLALLEDQGHRRKHVHPLYPLSQQSEA